MRITAGMSTASQAISAAVSAHPGACAGSSSISGQNASSAPPKSMSHPIALSAKYPRVGLLLLPLARIVAPRQPGGMPGAFTGVTHTSAQDPA
jgi:hypothetical protein